MDKSNIIKGVVQGLVGFGAGKIAKDVIKNNTNAESTVDKLTYAFGAYAIGGVVSEAAKKHIDAKFESVISSIEKGRAKAAQIKSDADAVDAIEEAKENPLDPDTVARVAQSVKDALNKDVGPTDV